MARPRRRRSRAPRRAPARRRRARRAITCGRDARLVAERDHARRRRRRAPRRRSAARPPGPPPSPRRRPTRRRCRSTRARISSASWPSTTTTRRDRRHGQHRLDARARAAGARRSGGELLGRRRTARPSPAARTSPPIAHTPTSWIAALGVREPAAVAAVAHRDDLGHDRERGLLGGQRAEVEPDRRGDALELRVRRRPWRAAARAGCSCARREPIAPM